MNEVTQLLDAAAAGDRQAAADLFPLVYSELRTLAAAHMASESPEHTLQPTALVHEVYIRMVGAKGADHWENRGHFFTAAAESMRRILVESARRKHTVKRGGQKGRVPLSDNIAAGVPEDIAELLVVDEVVDRLAAHKPQAADLVKLHVFAGLPLEEAAAALGLSARSGYRVWAYARAWMLHRLGGESEGAI